MFTDLTQPGHALGSYLHSYIQSPVYLRYYNLPVKSPNDTSTAELGFELTQANMFQLTHTSTWDVQGVHGYPF